MLHKATEAGPHLDALIARLLGRRVVLENDYGAFLELLPDDPEYPTEQVFDPCPSYSTDMNVAITLMSACCIDGIDRFERYWRVFWHIDETTPLRLGTADAVDAETLPLAICLAWLEWQKAVKDKTS